MAIGLRKELVGNPDNTLIYTEILLAGCQYCELTFGQENEKTEVLKSVLLELMRKLVKVANEKRRFLSDLEAAKLDMFEEAKKGIARIGSDSLAGSLENFLAQAKGALDIFAKQFLRETIGFEGKWDHKKIIACFKTLPNLGQEVVAEIERMLNEDADSWLVNMINDRNTHHEANYSLSPMQMVNGKPTLMLTSSNGEKTVELEKHIETLYGNVFGLVQDMMHLTIWSINPALKGIKLTQDYFLPEPPKE